ncbi:hypothetical protein K6V90_13420 [Cupriavidus pauculus]|uniref:primase 1D-like protein n=1 Tax=Cupriavidus pauculus TaxID=82633 RepID=UPI001C93211B|nr:hypothetical protein [Cupriavidus pauculus]MBY4731531.1 hypothetical protein [Cupriavidus pauculus]
MSLVDFRTHPVSLVPIWQAKMGINCVATLSRYRYIPQDVSDQREVLSVKLSELTASWLNEQLNILSDDTDLALHSVIRDGRRKLHIPMVDFAAGNLAADKVVSWASDYLGISLKIFDSGRSLHGYGLEPISIDKWYKFMGLLLLANKPAEPPLVDSRWIGHRLLAGYSALRWSANSGHYLKMPTLLK